MPMTHTIRVGLFGLGKAGKEVATQLQDDPAVKLCWAVRGSSHAHGNKQIFDTIPTYAASELNLPILLAEQPIDFIVDFSSADTCLSYADIASENGIGIISAVSSYKKRHLECLHTASKNTAVLYSPNITLGINFIIIAAKVLRKLAPHAGVEVIEEHFHDKKEVSGTAIRIAELLDLDADLHVNSIRVGGIVGRHEIIFGFPYQTIRLTHDSISRAAFGQGALFAIKNLCGRPNGFYTMEQLVSEAFSAALN
ncbi:4-hydroxy-tetrahydrodipicolinate reductase [mine drainage metagenome]|uniref:4-hydroxy-tetrahydrodipicolinate reductase n=1 Tax=mine drainage metagenome TaxID=410659 RepID=A0A1J5SKK2_9ZZZZ